MADDLDDQWAPASDVEEEAENASEHETPESEIKSSGKRKASEDAPATKKKKKKKNISTELQETEAQPLSAADLAEQMEKHLSGKLTPVELEEAKLDETHFAYCNDLSHTPNSFLDKILPKWKKLMGTATSPGSPLLLVVCPAALRATSLNRDMREFQRDECRVAKLFAKHMKLSQQEMFLKKCVVHVGVGTPNRLQALIECGALKLDALTHIVLDWSWRDSKLRRLVDIPEVRTDFFTLLTKHLIPVLRQGKAKLALL